ncbi:CRISPR-associated protein, Cmr5 family [Desulfofundulus kuznetsovii DSM 6115]|uniref:CRISPR type III-B/RAMP module-associated protein Cmr5 n=1 Tax=Desulfofundulus kuznetsovii (strain DSM 6115 / VKM B-1805 / 17) TaxID=760568 RepID=A0AAU8P8E5_DESK7|nr:CRISPR-associated protein, Cmr5 family [Desulfofundulus kuznetsovii DSM 6115]
MQTRNQEYAAKIFEQVMQVRDELGKDESNRYGSLAHRLPVLVRTAGLAQALAFVEARCGAAGRKLLRDIAAVVNEVNEEELLARSRTAELPEYMLLTRNVLAALAWYKRFAQSVLGVEAGADREGVDE